jgi:D-alanyl-lipoteichoic acid acyltransferase DltB (MBOAT superfamily)
MSTWTLWSYIATGWPMVLSHFIALKMTYRSTMLVKMMTCFLCVCSWYAWYMATMSQDLIHQNQMKNPKIYEHWNLWEPFSQREYTGPFLVQQWLDPDRWMSWNDLQFRFWRFNVDKLLLIVALFVTLRRIFRSYSYVYYNVIGIALLVYCHGYGGTTYLLFIYGLNLVIIKKLVGTKYLIPSIWILNLVILISSDLGSGFRIYPRSVHWTLAFLSDWRQLHWHIYFRFSLLRIISFACDYQWATINLAPSKHKDDYLFRLSETHLPINQYSTKQYFAYLLYAPLYLAGPVIGFNCFIHQLRSRYTQISMNAVSRLIGSVIFTHFLTFTLSYVYYNACLENLDIYHEFEAWEMISAALFIGWFMYSKFYMIWTFMQAWAEIDGIQTPNNVKGFFIPCYTFRDFWRSWNVSVHLWVMRYIYQPLGGTRSQLWSVWVIFLFVGVWHDIQLKWLAWVLFNCCCFCGEIVFIYMFSSKRFDWIRNLSYYEWIVSFAGAIDVVFIMMSNATIINGFHSTFIAFYQIFCQNNVYLSFMVVPPVMVTLTFGIFVLRSNKN